MGFLRKIGRKIKKGIKKLFSSKIGSFIGSIALSMIMGPVISRAFNGIKGVFTGAAQKGTETLVQEGVQKVVEEKAADVAAKGVIDNTVTGAMEKVVADNTMTNDLLLQAQEGLKGSVTEGMKAAKEGSKLLKDLSAEELTTLATEKTLPIKELGKEQLAKLASEDLTVGQNIRKGFREMGLGAREFVSDPFGKTKEFVGGDQFIPDVAKSVGTSLALGAIQGEPEQPFISGGVAPQPLMEPAQNAYVQTVQSQIPNFPVTNFQQLNQSLLYGTLSPQYLMGQAQYS